MTGHPDRIFLLSTLDDNNFVDKEEAEESLKGLNPVEYQQMRYGDWDILATGGVLSGSWFEVVSNFEWDGPQVRSWDVAGMLKRKDGRKSDETVGTLWRKNTKTGLYCIAEQTAFRGTPGRVEDTIERMMDFDEKTGITHTYEEKPPGEAGIERAEKRAKRFAGRWYVCGNAPGMVANKSKEERAGAMSKSAEHNLIKLLVEKPNQERWIAPFRAQCNIFGQPNVPNDRIDSASLGFNAIAFKQRPSFVRGGLLNPRTLPGAVRVDSLGRRLR